MVALWSTRVQLLAVLLKVGDNPLPAILTCSPFDKLVCDGRVLKLLSDYEMGWVEKRVIFVVSGFFVDSGLIGKVLWEREQRSSIGERVLLQLDGDSQGLDGEGNVLVVPRRVWRGPGHLGLLAFGNTQL